MRRIVKERVADAALVHQRHAKARLLRLDGAGQTGRPSANHKQIEDCILCEIHDLSFMHLD